MGTAYPTAYPTHACPITCELKGPTANYGSKKMTTKAQCKAMCDKHSDCAGFVHRDSDNNCNFWKGGAIAPFKHKGHHCYEKKAAATKIHVSVTHDRAQMGGDYDRKHRCYSTGGQCKCVCL